MKKTGLLYILALVIGTTEIIFSFWAIGAQEVTWKYKASMPTRLQAIDDIVKNIVHGSCVHEWCMGASYRCYFPEIFVANRQLSVDLMDIRE